MLTNMRKALIQRADWIVEVYCESPSPRWVFFSRAASRELARSAASFPRAGGFLARVRKAEQRLSLVA